jgi:hypothetical protein
MEASEKIGDLIGCRREQVERHDFGIARAIEPVRP